MFYTDFDDELKNRAFEGPAIECVKVSLRM